MHLAFVLYRSVSKVPLSTKVVTDIVASSIRNNPREGLTGFLHTEQDHFLQYLEGPINPLMRKVAQIQKDRRHRNFIILAEGDIDARFFPEWNMGRIDEISRPKPGPLMEKRWLRPDPDVDPLPLIGAFAAHAGHNAEITALDA